MCYRETSHYVVLCDRCGVAAPEGTGWWTPTLADRAALEAGWEMTPTEHLCPGCMLGEVTDDPGGGGAGRPALPPVAGSSSRPDVCWPPPASPAAARSWQESR